MKKKFIILAESGWDSGGIGGNSSQQYARTLMRLGWEVGYVEPKGTWKLQPIDGTENAGNTVVMCNFPYTEENRRIFFDLARLGCRNICLIVDHWKEIDVDKHYRPELEAEFIKSARQVFACSPLNIDRLRFLRSDIALLRNGVDLAHFVGFQPESAVVVPRGRITLGVAAGFWISRWIDLNPLLEYAANHPEDRVNIIGNTKALIGEDECPSNVILHGVKHWKEIPLYLHQFDVCIVPYNPLTTRYTNPLKVLEYLACGKPVVSCYNSSIADYPRVYFYGNKEEFEESVQKAVSEPVDAESMADFLRKNTWEERIKTMLAG